MTKTYQKYYISKKEHDDLIIPLNYDLVMKSIFQEFKIIPAMFIHMMFKIDLDEVLNNSYFNDTFIANKNFINKARCADLVLVCKNKWVVNFESNRKISPFTQVRNHDYLFGLVGSMVNKNEKINKNISYYQVNFNYMGTIGKIFYVKEQIKSNDKYLNKQKSRYNFRHINLDYLDKIKYTKNEEEKFLDLCELMITTSLKRFKELLKKLGLDERIGKAMEDFSKDGFILGEYDKEEEIRKEFRSLTDWYQEEKEELIKKSELEKQQYEAERKKYQEQTKQYQEQTKQYQEQIKNTIKLLLNSGLDSDFVAKAVNTSLTDVLKIKKQIVM